MKAKFIRDMQAGDDTPDSWVTVSESGARVCEAGLVFEHPDCFWHVLMGNAESADKECEDEVSRRRTKAQLETARQAMDELVEVEADGQSQDEDEDDDEGDSE